MTETDLSRLMERVERLEHEVGIKEKEFGQDVETLARQLRVDVKEVKPSEPGRVAHLELPDAINARARELLEDSGLKWSAELDPGVLEVW